MKFIHCADLHLDSPLLGLDRYEGAPVEEVRGATRRALENMIALAHEESVDFVVIAGDLFDGDWPDFNTGLFFAKQISKLNEAGIKVFILRGNHDAESKITKAIPLPSNVVTLPADAPRTVLDDSLGIAVHGQSFLRPAIMDDLAIGYPQRVSGYFNLGILHTSLTGREGHAKYAPTHVETLVSKGYDYWALGHVHKHEIVSRDPWIVFPGNMQGRMIRETGGKGCILVKADERDVKVEHRALDVVRWELLGLDVSGVDTLDDVYDRFRENLSKVVAQADGRTVAVRVEVRGRCRAHEEMLAKPETIRSHMRAVALDESHGHAWLEKIYLEAQPEYEGSGLSERDDPVGELVRLCHVIKHDDGELANLSDELSDISRKLPPELREGMDPLMFENPELLRRIVGDVERTLIPRMMKAKDDQ